MKENNYSTFVDGDLRADVIKLDNHWGCRFYDCGEIIKTEFYKGHNEMYLSLIHI